MSGIERPEKGDYLSSDSGQNVHCNRAFFIASAFPHGFRDRIELGVALGIGLALGAIAATGLVAFATKAFEALSA